MDRYPFNKEEMSKNLDRINFWISNCDTKISFALAFSGVLLAVFFTSNVIHGSLKKLTELVKTIDADSLVVILNLILLIAFFISLVLALCFFLMGLKGSTNSYDYSQSGLTTNSLIFFGTIKGKDFVNYKREVNSVTEGKLENDYLSQVHINATICQKKFDRYNTGIKFLISSVVLFILLNFTLLFL